MTKVIRSLNEWKLVENTFSIGFVPTMGNLHLGHESLLQKAKQENALSVLSIYVNPTQFNNPDDLKNYPRTLDQDLAIAEKCGVDYVLLPSYEELYPDNYEYKISNKTAHTQLEGASRPGHFDGVLTVVMKLLMLVKPARAYFGEKDYEQLQLIKGMAAAFFLDTEIVPCPTVRNENGLALSSRNNRLTAEQYQLAQKFPQIFHSPSSCAEIKKNLTEQGFLVDYIQDYQGRRFGAVFVGNVRLIDNFSPKTLL